MLLLPACGKEEPQAPSITGNPFLKDVEQFNAEYFKTPEPSPTLAPDMTWIPHGNYTYVLAGDENYWSTALFNVQSFDLETHTAVLTYVIKDNKNYYLAQISGANPREGDYFLSSDGALALGCDEIYKTDGARVLKIYLDKTRWLEFEGTGRLETAYYHHNNYSYRLKYEG